MNKEEWILNQAGDKGDNRCCYFSAKSASEETWDYVLEQALEVIKFYADKKNWFDPTNTWSDDYFPCGGKSHVAIKGDSSPSWPEESWGGKKARDFLDGLEGK